MKKPKKFETAKEIMMSNLFLDRRSKSEKYVHHEFQDYGYRLAVQLGDMTRVSMFIKLAKTVDRNILNQALSFAKDYPKAKNKSKIFLWKLKEIRLSLKERLNKPKIKKEKKNDTV